LNGQRETLHVPRGNSSEKALRLMLFLKRGMSIYGNKTNLKVNVKITVFLELLINLSCKMFFVNLSCDRAEITLSHLSHSRLVCFYTLIHEINFGSAKAANLALAKSDLSLRRFAVVASCPKQQRDTHFVLSASHRGK
jgi:hypothetical protein